MAEYRIVAKIDPQTAAGSQKVKQDLRGVQQEANATSAALNRSFDQAKFDKTVGGLVARLDQVEKGLGRAGQASTSASSQFDKATGSIERMTAAEFRAAGGMEGLERATKQAAGSTSQYEAAVLRVTRAVDAEAAEQLRLNGLLAEAKRLLDAGAISQERYAQVQALSARTGQDVVAVTGAQRIGMQQLGFQLGDVATMYSLGAKPAQIFGSQIGQISQALMLMGGDNGSMLSRVAAFLSGPWGIALVVGTLLLTPFVSKLLEGNDALDDAVKKLRDDAREAENAAKAQDIFRRSIEGATAAIIERNQRLKEGLQTQRDVLLKEIRDAERDQITQRKGIEDARREVEAARAAVAANNRPALVGGGSVAGAAGLAQALAQSRAADRLAEAEKEFAKLTGSAAAAEESVRRAWAELARDSATRAADPVARENAKYDQLVASTTRAAIASGQNAEALARELTLIEFRRKAAVEAAQAQDKLNGSVAKGVAIFRSREQAVGIAGREFQREGFRVTENDQFGGVKGNHPGMGNKPHGRFAIDINEGTGITEADVPDLRAKFDAAAKRYAARGFKVLWNGKVYWPSGKVTAIEGANKHRDHMHLEAPATIVGKATGASSESQFAREEGQSERVAERAEDFVTAVQIRAASQGVPADRQSQLNAQIDEALAEFTRRFEREATAGEAATIRKALTDADVRETAQRFDEAYVQPLNRLRALQGSTGLEREILNAKLEETIRLGRELTPVEAAMIDNGIRQSDQLTRQQQILEQIAGPIAEYRSSIEALNALFLAGKIELAEYNARMGQMGAAASQFKGSLPGNDSSGNSFADTAAREEAMRQRDDQMAQLQSYLAQGTILESEAAAIRIAIWRQYGDNIREIDAKRLDSARQVLNQLSQLQNSKSRELAAIGKAAAVTQATMDAYLAINKALATLPPPFNIAMAGAIGATAFANVASILGLKDGGWVTGPGGPRDDRVPIMGSAGEFMVNARDAQRNRPLLEAINQGRDVRQAGLVTASAGAAAAPGRVIVQPTPAPEVNIRQINVTDPRMINDYLSGPAGEKIFTNWVNGNPEVVARAAQQGS